jgi:hypothetical protein
MSITLQPGRHAGPAARRFVYYAADQWLGGARLADVLTVVNELVCNAATHAQTSMVLNIEPMKVRAKDAVRVDYVFVADPALATPNSIPVVARGSDVLIRQGDNMTVARLLATSDAFDGLAPVWDRLLGSLELR